MSQLGETLKARFFITLILSSLLTGVGIGIGVAIQRDLVQGMKAAVAAFFVVGVLMGMIIIPVQVIATRKLTSEECQLNQLREFKMAGAVLPVLELLYKALSELTFIRDIEVNKNGRRIAAKTRMSWASFGEVILVEVSDAEEGKVLVKVSSSPALRFTAADYGKNARNLQAMFRKLEVLGIRTEAARK